jgi:hypothetical protein
MTQTTYETRMVVQALQTGGMIASKVRLHKRENASHPVGDCIVSYIRKDTFVTNELFLNKSEDLAFSCCGHESYSLLINSPPFREMRISNDPKNQPVACAE